MMLTVSFCDAMDPEDDFHGNGKTLSFIEAMFMAFKMDLHGEDDAEKCKNLNCIQIDLEDAMKYLK